MDEDLILAPSALAMQPFDEGLLLPLGEDGKTTIQSTGHERQASMLDTAMRSDADTPQRQHSSWSRAEGAAGNAAGTMVDLHGSSHHGHDLHSQAGSGQVRGAG